MDGIHCAESGSHHESYGSAIQRPVEIGSPIHNFINNYSLPADGGDGFGTSGNLSAPVVRQVGDGGMVQKAPGTSPCDPNTGNAGVPGGPTAVHTGWSELQGFSPFEIDL